LEKRFGVNDPKHRFRILTELASLCGKRPPVNKDALSRHETLMRRKVGRERRIVVSEVYFILARIGN